MRHVGTIEALALHDEGLGPDRLLGRAQLDRHAEHGRLDRVLEPSVVDHGDAVAGTEDDVDHALGGDGLGQPVRERDLGPAADRREHGERGLEIATSQEDVQILRVSRDAGVALEREGATDQERKLRLDESGEGLAIQRALGHAADRGRVHGCEGCSIHAVELRLSSKPGFRTLAGRLEERS